MARRSKVTKLPLTKARRSAVPETVQQRGHQFLRLVYSNAAVGGQPYDEAATLSLLRVLDFLGFPPQHNAAIKLCDQVIRLYPDWDAAHALRGTALTLARRFEEALATLNRAVDLNPNFELTHVYHAVALSETGQYEEAIKASDRAIALRDEYADVHVYRGIALTAISQPEEARKSFERAIALGASDTFINITNGNLLQRFGRPNEAIESYTTALETIKAGRAPDDLTNLADILLGLCRYNSTSSATKAIEGTNHGIVSRSAKLHNLEYYIPTTDGEADNAPRQAVANDGRDTLARTKDYQRAFALWMEILKRNPRSEILEERLVAIRDDERVFQSSGAARETTTRLAPKTMRANARSHAQHESAPHAGNDLKLSSEQVAAVIADSTLGRLQTRYDKLLTTKLPASGLKDVKQARLAAKLSTTFDNLQARRKELGLPPLPKDTKVTEARRLSSAFYRKERTKEPTRSAPRSRRSTAGFAA